MRLFKIEWLKLKKYRTFYILSGLFMFVAVLINYAVNKEMFNIKTNNGPAGKQSFGLFSNDYTFPQVYENVVFWFGWAIIFLCVLVIINISNEYSFKTQRQSIIDGFSRIDFLHSKVALIIGINVALTVFYFIVTLIFGIANGDTQIFDGAKYILYMFLCGMNYLSFAALITLFIKRSGLSIMILFSYIFFESIIKLIIDNFTQYNIGKFLPLDSSDSLLATPFSTMAAMMKGNENDKSTTIMVAMSVLYILGYYFIARLRMQKADL